MRRPGKTARAAFYDGANVRSLLGQELPRRYELTGRRLVLRSTRPDEHWSVTWERY